MIITARIAALATALTRLISQTKAEKLTRRVELSYCRVQPCLKKYPIGYLCAESAAGSREPQRNRLGAESALADALGRALRGDGVGRQEDAGVRGVSV